MAKSTVKGTKVERQLHEVFKKKPDINQPGRLLAHLHNELNGQYSLVDISLALERMERKHTIKLQRSGKVFNRVMYAYGADTYAAGDQSAEAKRQRRFARGIPSTLSDDQCSPVEVRQIKPQSADPTRIGLKVAQLDISSTGLGIEEVIEVSEPKYENGVPTPEILTLALIALVTKSDENGVVSGNSASKIIQEGLNCGQSQSVVLNRLLGQMGLRKTQKLGGGTFRHTVDLSTNEVTADMLRCARAQVSVNAKGDAPSSTVQMVETLSLADSPSVAYELTNERDIVERLMLVIGQLEGEREQLLTEVATLRREYDAVAEQLTRYEEMVAQIQKQTTRHREDVEVVLRRYSV